MVKEEITINLSLFHGRPSQAIASTARQFKSDIVLEANGTRVNGKSTVAILDLQSFDGDKVVVFVKGEDEKEALEAITEVILDIKKVWGGLL